MKSNVDGLYMTVCFLDIAGLFNITVEIVFL
jgi:hypothetical protein